MFTYIQYIQMRLASSGERVNADLMECVDVSLRAAMVRKLYYVRSTIQVERLGLVFYRFKKANTSPTDRADCPAYGAYNAEDSLWNELSCVLLHNQNEFPSTIERWGVTFT